MSYTGNASPGTTPEPGPRIVRAPASKTMRHYLFNRANLLEFFALTLTRREC